MRVGHQFRILVVVFVATFSFANLSAVTGWTKTAEIKHIEVIRGQGFQMQGTFGNPAECTVANHIFIPINHPQYDELYSLAMVAFTSNYKIRGYIHTCIEYGWHGGSYNQLSSSGSLYIFK